MTIGEVIKAYRKENNLSQRAFAKKCEMSNGYISMLENDKNPTTGKEISITIEKLKALADGMEISLSNLLDIVDDIPVDISGNDNLTEQPDTEDIFAKYPNIFKPQMKKVPLLGKTACGEPIYSPNFDDGFALINSDITADFALEAEGDSMINAQINDGDIVFFVAQNNVDNGQIAAVFIDNAVTLKRVYYYRDENKLVLQPENPKYPPKIFNNEELNSIRIIGRAVAHIRKL